VILFDTHSLIWWADGDRQRLSPGAQAAIEEEIEAAGRPSGSPGLLVSVHLLPLDPGVAVAATRLPEPFHGDPADRFLVAQARALAIPLLSADSKIRGYGHVRTLW
jgi:PIN domain nuclease of toxin-antitoxin system